MAPRERVAHKRSAKQDDDNTAKRRKVESEKPYVPMPTAKSKADKIPAYVPTPIAELQSRPKPRSVDELKLSIAKLQAANAELDEKPSHHKGKQAARKYAEISKDNLEYSERFWQAVRTIRARMRNGQSPNLEYYCDYFQVDYSSVREIYKKKEEVPEKYSNLTPEEYRNGKSPQGGEKKRRKVDIASDRPVPTNKSAWKKAHERNASPSRDKKHRSVDIDTPYVPKSSNNAKIPVYEPTPISELNKAHMEKEKGNVFDRSYSLRYWLAVENIRERYLQKKNPNSKFYCEYYEVDYISVLAIYPCLDETAAKYGFMSPEQYYEQMAASGP